MPWSKLQEALRQSVAEQAPAEVRGAVYLSGGLDTPGLAALARRSPSRWPDLTGLTVGFGDDSDERQAARELAEHLGIDHAMTSLTPADFADLLPRVIWHLDEPRVGASVQVYAAAALAKQAGATVVLSGTGADELFGGYPWRYRRVMGLTDPLTFERAYFAEWCRVTTPATHSDLFTPAILWEADPSDLEQRVVGMLAQTRGWHPLHRALAFDAQTFLHGLLLVEDKLSMAHGVEVRVPYLSNAVVSLAQRLGPELKDDKLVLRQALRGLLPAAHLARPKVGFAPPLAAWLRGPLDGTVRETLLSERCLGRGWFQSKAIRSIVDGHAAGQDYSKALWSLLTVEWWARLFLDGEPMAARPEADRAALSGTG